MKAEALIFDLDGTLLHTIEDIGGAANRLLEKHGLPTHGTSDYLRWVGNGAAKFIERALPGAVERRRLLEYVAEFKEIYSAHLHEKSHVYDGIDKMLDNLEERGIPFSILSNKPHLLTRKVVSHYFPDRPFAEVYGQREEVPRKPHPAAAFQLARLMNVDTGKVLFVGDSNTDILTAQAACMPVVAVSWGYGRLLTEGVEGDYPLVDDPARILDYV